MEAIAQFRTQLKELERERGVRVLFASIGGSRAYGLADRESDWDCHFVFVHPVESYLSLSRPSDYISCGADFNGWELGKFLGMTLKGAYSVHELLTSPLPVWNCGDFWDEMSLLAKRFFSPFSIGRACCGYVASEVKKYDKSETARARVKSTLSMVRLYMLGKLSVESGKFPPVPFDSLSALCCDYDKDWLASLAAAKRNADYKEWPRERLDALVERTKTLADDLFASLKDKRDTVEGTFEELDAFFKRIVRNENMKTI